MLWNVETLLGILGQAQWQSVYCCQIFSWCYCGLDHVLTNTKTWLTRSDLWAAATTPATVNGDPVSSWPWALALKLLLRTRLSCWAWKEYLIFLCSMNNCCWRRYRKAILCHPTGNKSKIANETDTSREIMYYESLNKWQRQSTNMIYNYQSGGKRNMKKKSNTRPPLWTWHDFSNILQRK